MKKTIRIVQLYPREMNIYGDHGNVLVLQKRLEWSGYTAEILPLEIGGDFPERADIVIGGGGQDSNQVAVAKDILRHKKTIHRLAAQGTPMLVICGLYQLFGHSFTTLEGTKLDGIGLFDMETIGTEERLIGNIVTKSEQFGEIIGYENHSGQTTLDTCQPLGIVVTGEGNNSSDTTEGARIHNAIGSYLHGSLLPKNPAIADFLLATAIKNRHNETFVSKCDDSIAENARVSAANRPR